jgi:thiol-disulfide isomerase/thioredoxin
MRAGRRVQIILAAIVSVFVLLWFLFPGPFARGLLVGMLLTLVLLGGGGLLVVKRLRKRLGSELNPPPLPTAYWDYSMELSDLSGAHVDCSQFAGKVLVLNFWATWCGPCVAEMPSFSGLRQRTADLDVRLAFVTSETTADVNKFLSKRAMDLPIYLLSGEPPDCFKARAIPATFILDGSGMIAMRHFGAAKWDDDGVVDFVRGLAAASSG